MLAVQQAEVGEEEEERRLRIAEPDPASRGRPLLCLSLLGIGNGSGPRFAEEGREGKKKEGAWSSALSGAPLVPLSVCPGGPMAAAPVSPGYWAMSAFRPAAEGKKREKKEKNRIKRTGEEGENAITGGRERIVKRKRV